MPTVLLRLWDMKQGSIPQEKLVSPLQKDFALMALQKLKIDFALVDGT